MKPSTPGAPIELRLTHPRLELSPATSDLANLQPFSYLAHGDRILLALPASEVPRENILASYPIASSALRERTLGYVNRNFVGTHVARSVLAWAGK